MPDLSICFKEAYLPLQVPTYKENCYSFYKSGNLGKISETNTIIEKMKTEESSSGNLKIKIFQGPLPTENLRELKVKLPEAKLPQN